MKRSVTKNACCVACVWSIFHEQNLKISSVVKHNIVPTSLKKNYLLSIWICLKWFKEIWESLIEIQSDQLCQTIIYMQYVLLYILITKRHGLLVNIPTIYQGWYSTSKLASKSRVFFPTSFLCPKQTCYSLYCREKKNVKCENVRFGKIMRKYLKTN